MAEEPLVLVGGGGHCKSVIDVIESCNDFAIHGIIDPHKHGEILGYPIIGSDDDLKAIIKDVKSFLITLGQTKSADKRKKLFNWIKELGGHFPVIKSASARISRFSSIGEGTVVMHNVLINAGAKIGVNCILNSGAIIEHDCQVSDNCHISTQAVLNGEVLIGEEVFVGSNAVVSHSVSIGSCSTIGAGSVVVESFSEASLIVGNPARNKFQG